jgi:uncharacterized membrane protein (DUF4010 family)
MPVTIPSPALNVLVAALGAAAIGLERQWSGHASGPNARFAGIRTFTLLGASAGTAGWLASQGFVAPATAIIAGLVALAIAGYARASANDIDATTEAAALIATAAGTLAGLGHLATSSGIVAVTVVLLVEKPRLHRMVSRLKVVDIHAASRFLVMAVVILPLLPAGPFGPLGGVRPRELWIMVLLFSGLSFMGYAAQRVVGPSRGYRIAGVLGGLVSSTSVALTFARLSRTDHGTHGALAAGVIGACSTLFPRVVAASFVLDASTATALLPLFALPFLAGLLMTWTIAGDTARAAGASGSEVNPLQLLPALQMAALFQVVLFAVHAVDHYWGSSGRLMSGVVLGLTDVDALTISLTKLASADGMPALAARAITIGVIANTVLKTTIVLTVGAGAFRWKTAAGLAGLAASLVLSLLLVG